MPTDRQDILRRAVLPASRRGLLGGSLALGGLLGLKALGPNLAGRALAQDVKRGGTLRVACPPAANLDPVKMESGGAIAIVQQAAEYLVWVEGDLSLRPVLATSWATPDGGTTWDFVIRQGVRFHDGRPLTPDDVVATFRRLVDPAAASVAASQFAFLKGDNVTRVGEDTVRFVLDRPIGRFPYYTQTYNAVILPADYKGDFATNPVGTGPFRLTAYEPQQGATFARNAEYWDKGKPHLDAVSISLFENPQAMTLALQGGQVDVLLQSSHIDALPLAGDPSLTIARVPAAEHRQVTMRTDQKPFDDKRVRQAVALCLQRAAVVRGLLGGQADLGNDHAVAPLYPEKVDLPQREADVERATALLAEAGYADGFDIDLYTAQYQELPQYAQLMQQMLAPAGIRATLKIEPLTVYYEHWTEVGFGITDWTSRPTSDQILATAFLSDAEYNAAKWKNPEFDDLVARLQAEPDEAARARLAQRIAAIMHDEVPAVIAYFNNNLRPMRNNVAGVEASISQFLDLTRASLA